MADNIAVKNDASTTVGTLAADDIGSVLYPRTKLVIGADGTNDGDVSSANPLPISVATIPSHAVTNAGTFVVQENGAALTSLQLIDDAVYTDGAGTPSKGVAVMGTDGTNPQIISVSAAGLVGIADGGGSITVDGTVAVSGTVTTSGTVTEANSAAIAASLSVMDDWDETNRAAVNLISGQAGVAAGAGAVDATTQRVTHASDDPAVTALQLIDDAIVADDAAFTPATTKVMMVGATFDDTTPDTVNEGDAGAVRMSANRNLYVNIRDNAGNERGLNVDASGNITANITGTVTVGSHAVTNVGTFVVQVDGTALTRLTDIETNTDSGAVVGNGAAATAQRVTLANDGTGILATVTNVATIGTSVTPGTSAAHLGKAEDAAHASGDTGVMALAVRSDTAAATGGTDGDYTALVTDSTGRLWCNVSNTLTVASHAVTNAGTFAVQAACAGEVAHDAADSGSPQKNGAKATTALSGLTLVANADRTDLFAGVDGVLIVRPHSNLEDVVQERTTNTDGASTAFASGLAAPGAGVRLWITNMTIANSSASFCTVDLRDGAAGSVLWTVPVPATGGAVCRFDPPLKLTANTALAFDASAATSTLSISANGFKSKV